MNPDYKILGADWFTPMQFVPNEIGRKFCIGIVAIESYEGSWKAYIGLGDGSNEGEDEQNIARHGAKVNKAMAVAAFPYLDPSKFTY